MDNFPVYDILINQINKQNVSKDLTAAQKTELIKKIETLDDDGWESIAIIIKMYEKKSEQHSDDVLFPYGAKVNSMNGASHNITLDLLLLPIKLRHMINIFVNMHHAKLESEKRMGGM